MQKPAHALLTTTIAVCAACAPFGGTSDVADDDVVPTKATRRVPLPDRAPDGGGADAGATTSPAFVQSGIAHMTAVSIPTTIAPTGTGNLVVVAVANEFDVGTVASIHDNAPGGSNTYLSANQKSRNTLCHVSSEIWYAKDVRPGATSVVVTMTNEVEIEAWVMEFSGLSRTNPLDEGATIDNGPVTAVVSAPVVTPSVAKALVVSTACVCESITGIQPGNAFTNLPIQVGEATAFHVTDKLGAFGAVWSAITGTFNASTVAFK